MTDIFAGDPVCPDCGNYLSNTWDDIGRHVCQAKAALEKARIEWDEFIKAYDLTKQWPPTRWVIIRVTTKTQAKISERWTATFAHWQRYPQKGKRAKRMKGRFANA